MNHYTTQTAVSFRAQYLPTPGLPLLSCARGTPALMPWSTGQRHSNCMRQSATQPVRTTLPHRDPSRTGGRSQGGTRRVLRSGRQCRRVSDVMAVPLHNGHSATQTPLSFRAHHQPGPRSASRARCARNPCTGAMAQRPPQYRPRHPQSYQPSLRSFQSGFIDSIRATFFSRRKPLICFSRAMAALTSVVVS